MKKILITLIGLLPCILFAQQTATLQLAPNEVLYAHASHPDHGMALFTTSDHETKKGQRFLGVYFYNIDLSKKWELKITHKEFDLAYLYSGHHYDNMSFYCLAGKDYIYLFCKSEASSFKGIKPTIFKIDYEGKYEILQSKSEVRANTFIEFEGSIYTFWSQEYKNGSIPNGDKFEYYKLVNNDVFEKKEIVLLKKKCAEDKWVLNGFTEGEFCFSCYDQNSMDKEGFLNSSVSFAQLDGKSRTVDFKIKLAEEYFAVPATTERENNMDIPGPNTLTMYDPVKKEAFFFGAVNYKKPGTFSSRKHMGFYVSKFKIGGSLIDSKVYVNTKLKSLLPFGSNDMYFKWMIRDSDKYLLQLTTNSIGEYFYMDDKFEITSNTSFNLPEKDYRHEYWKYFNFFKMPSNSDRFPKAYNAKELELIKKLDAKLNLGLFNERYYTADVKGGKLVVPNVFENKTVTIYYLPD